MTMPPSSSFYRHGPGAVGPAVCRSTPSKVGYTKHMMNSIHDLEHRLRTAEERRQRAVAALAPKHKGYDIWLLKWMIWKLL